LTWPVASYYFKKFNEKITFVLAEDIPHADACDSLLRHQDFTEDIIISQHKKYWGLGGQPYVFNPKTYGIEGEYINLGISEFPNIHFTDYYGMKTNLGVDNEYRIKIPTNNSINLDDIKDKICVFNDYGIIGKHLDLSDEKYHVLDFSNDMAYNAYIAKNSKAVISTFSASSILADWGNFPNYTCYIPKDKMHLPRFYSKNTKDFIPY